MYIQDKDEAKQLLYLLQDALDDVYKWDAYHDDVLNEELGVIQTKIEELNTKLKTL